MKRIAALGAGQSVTAMPLVERPDPAPSGPCRRLKVLLAEDNPTNRHLASRMLTRLGHAVDAVQDGAQAVSAAAARNYDVILMDVMMPEVDGLTATRAIRASEPPRCNITIIGLTANTLPAGRDACFAAGMNDYLSKPVTLERLRTVLDQTAAANPAGAGTPVTSPAAATLDAGFLRQLGEQIGIDGVSEMIGIFLEDTPGRLAAIRRGLTQGANQTVRREAHALAGAASTVGLPRLSAAAGALQIAAERSGANEADVEIVAAALHDSLLQINAWAKAHPGLAPSNV